MKNLKNIGLGLATLFFAFSIVFSMSSFKGEVVDTHEWQKYNRDGSPDGLPVLGDQMGPFANECTGENEVCAIGIPLNPNTHVEIIYRYE